MQPSPEKKQHVTDLISLDSPEHSLTDKTKHTHLLDIKPPRTLRFVNKDYTFKVDVPVKPQLLIGRKTTDEDFQVDVDTTPLNGMKYGVSRYHALIVAIDNRLFIKDFNSTNGTRVNSHRLQPMEASRLRHGDLITMGQLTLYVQYINDEENAEQELRTRVRIDQTYERIKALQWETNPVNRNYNISNVDLMREFLRRMILWADALDAQQEWPLVDITKRFKSSQVFDLSKLPQMQDRLYPNMYVRLTCQWALSWSLIQCTPALEHYKLPSPFEPLLQMFENGASFTYKDKIIIVREPSGITRELPLMPSLYNTPTPFIDINEKAFN